MKENDDEAEETIERKENENRSTYVGARRDSYTGGATDPPRPFVYVSDTVLIAYSTNAIHKYLMIQKHMYKCSYIFKILAN